MSDAVDHPQHYNALGAKCKACGEPIECIDVVERMSFNIGNVVKYVWRADFKDAPLDDLKKAAWYINREIAKRRKPPEAQQISEATRGSSGQPYLEEPEGIVYAADPSLDFEATMSLLKRFEKWSDLYGKATLSYRVERWNDMNGLPSYHGLDRLIFEAPPRGRAAEDVVFDADFPRLKYSSGDVICSKLVEPSRRFDFLRTFRQWAIDNYPDALAIEAVARYNEEHGAGWLQWSEGWRRYDKEADAIVPK